MMSILDIVNYPKDDFKDMDEVIPPNVTLFGKDFITLTREQIQAILDGKTLCRFDGEGHVFISLKKEEYASDN